MQFFWFLVVADTSFCLKLQLTCSILRLIVTISCQDSYGLALLYLFTDVYSFSRDQNLLIASQVVTLQVRINQAEFILNRYL